MADGKLVEMNPDLFAKYSSRIDALQAELEALGVSREKLQLEKLNLVEIRELGTALADQLKQRKKWLGVK